MGANALETALPDAFAIARRELESVGRPGDFETFATVLADGLYRDWYCAVGSKPGAHRQDRDLCELLRAAHAGTGRFEDGWRVDNVSKRGRVAVSRNSERRIVHMVDCLPAEGHGAGFRPGDQIRVVARRDSESMNPGDWVTFSRAWHHHRDATVRTYWNIMPEGAARLVQLLSEALDDDFPFFIKCPRRPPEYDRRDAVVLYLPVDRFAAAASAIGEAASVLDDMLEAPVPALTLPLGRGVGVAEDPAEDNQSFGTSRCELVAGSIVHCLDAGHTDDEAWSAAALAAFQAAGLSAARPWANGPGGPDYALP